MHLVSSGRTSLLSRTVCCFSTFSCKRAGSDIESLERRDSQMIQGYPDRPSVLPGGALTLHVSTDAPQFRVDFYRQGQTLVFMGNLGGEWMAGQNVPQGRPNQDWGWPSYAFPIPGDWPSGAYIAIFIEGDANGNQ